VQQGVVVVPVGREYPVLRVDIAENLDELLLVPAGQVDRPADPGGGKLLCDSCLEGDELGGGYCFSRGGQVRGGFLPP
jgi:hypothetical protein